LDAARAERMSRLASGMIDAACKAYEHVLLQVAEGYRRPLPESWPPELKVIVTACMAQQPRDRPSADQVQPKPRRLQP